jgi:hypothetical protein
MYLFFVPNLLITFESLPRGRRGCLRRCDYLAVVWRAKKSSEVKNFIKIHNLKRGAKPACLSKISSNFSRVLSCWMDLSTRGCFPVRRTIGTVTVTGKVQRTHVWTKTIGTNLLWIWGWTFLFSILDILDALLHDLGYTRLVLANPLSHSLMVDVSVYDLRDTRS